MATLGECPQKPLPNGKKRRVARPCGRLELDIHVSLHFCSHYPKVAAVHCEGKPVKFLVT